MRESGRKQDADTYLRTIARKRVRAVRLRRGDRVSVKLAPGFENPGQVDAISSDHSVVWVNLDGGRGRTLVHCGDGVEIVPQES